MFALKRYFALFGMAGMASAGVALALLFHQTSSELVKMVGLGHVEDQKHFVRHIIERHLPSSDQQVLVTPGQLRGKLDQIDDVLKYEFISTPITNINVFTLDGIIAYSKDRNEIGQPVDDFREFQKALLGETVVKFIDEAVPPTVGKAPKAKHVVEVYFPLRNKENNLTSIVEFYIDLSEPVAKAQEEQARLILKIFVIMALLYGALYLLIRHANRVLKNQSETIQEEMRDHARMAQALLDSEHRLRLITDALPVLIAYIDRGLRFRFANRAYQEWFGRPPWEIAGKRLDELPELSDLSRIGAQIGLDGVNVQEVCIESQVLTRNGSWRNVHATYLPHLTPEGEVLGFFSLVQDVTSQKEAEKTLRRAQGELEAKVEERTRELSQEIAERRLSEARILASQTALKAMYNITSSQELGFAEKVRSLIEFGNHHFEMTSGFLVRVEGTSVEVQFSVSERADLVPGYIHVLDAECDGRLIEPVAFTGKEAEEWQDHACRKLLHFNSMLAAQVEVGGAVYGSLTFACEQAREQDFRPTDREIIRLMAQWIGGEIARIQKDAELRDAKENAEEASKAKSEFLATISHELRTPLNAIIGFADLMMMKAFGPLGHENYEGYLQSIRDSGQHLLKIINDILDVSKIEAGKLDLNEESFDIVETGREALRLTEHKASEGGLQLAFELPAKRIGFYGDRRRILQILLNLLSNAIKFTPSGGKVSLFLSVLDDKRVRMTVADTGIGMAPKDIEKALMPFGQVDSRLSRSQEGTGLGLPLTKSLSEMHQADFDIVSTPWIGTKVIITFPANRFRA